MTDASKRTPLPCLLPLKRGEGGACELRYTQDAAILSSLLCLLFSFSLARGESIFSAKYSPVVPGLDYAHLQITNQPWSIPIARLERSRTDFDILTTLGKGTIQGLSSLPAQVQAVRTESGRPVAAINGDFFVIRPGPYQGDPEGLQILDGELVSAPSLLSFWVERRRFH